MSKKATAKKIRRVNREQEIAARRTHGDAISRNAAGVMEKGKRAKRRARRAEGKKACKEY